MDMYSNKAASIPQKVTITVIEIGLIALSAWILFASGEEIVGGFFGWKKNLAIESQSLARRWTLLAFSLFLLLRMAFTMFRLMHRAIPWAESLSIPLAFAIYYVGFSILVLPSTAPLDIFDAFAVALYLFGAYLNTGSELGRERFKRKPENKGKLYTEGLFAWSMHINFFGDILWVVAYTIVARNPWGIFIPVLLTVFFAFFNVPTLDRYLADRYGEAFEDYRKRSKRLIPFVW